MPKASLRFNLNDPDDRMAFAVACRAQDLLMTIEEFFNQVRQKVKFGDHRENNNLDGLEEARTIMWNIMKEKDLTSLID